MLLPPKGPEGPEGPEGWSVSEFLHRLTEMKFRLEFFSHLMAETEDVLP